jgi:hypothetical protein
MIYRKRGSVARWENGTLVRVTERGMAIEKEELFECYPDAGGDTPHVDESRVVAAAHAVQEGVGDVTIERLIVIEGIAEHELIDDDEGSVIRRWTEHTRRMHISLMHARTRAILDLGFFETKDVVRVAAVLARSDGVEREAPPRLRLAPHVTAALIPSLIGIVPPNVRLLQTAGGIDGYGEPIVEAGGGWPNAYRPSYRMRPVRMPMQLRLECDVTAIDRSRPVAAALLAPVSIVDGALVLRVLIDEGDRAFPSTVRVARIDAVSDERIWYPYGGGSFGAEMML